MDPCKCELDYYQTMKLTDPLGSSVTTTNQAVRALKLLRENKNKFGLVISNVNMPEMDGFKLLELIGFEMELPVIMMSTHSDTEHVKKGVIHGACDYLLKPVRIEEPKNVWQHVLRRKKSSAKNQMEIILVKLLK